MGQTKTSLMFRLRKPPAPPAVSFRSRWTRCWMWCTRLYIRSKKQDPPGRTVAANTYFVQPFETQIGETTAWFNAGRLHLFASALPTTWWRAIDLGQEDNGIWA